MTSFPVTASIVGLGPAGRIAAHRAAARGWDVTAYDPAGGTLPSTIGLWCDQLPDWLPSDFLAATFRPSVILADGAQRQLTRIYGIINKDSLQNLGGFRTERRALSNPDTTGTDITIVTTGRTHAATGRGGQVRQLAIGHIFSLDDVPSAHRRPVLMDFTPADPTAPDSEPASFSYRIFLDDHTFLVEETILATPTPKAPIPCGKPAENGAVAVGEEAGTGSEVDDSALLALLRNRQSMRLNSLGLSEELAVDEEVVSFPLLAICPPPEALCGDRPSRGAIPFGFAGGWMHPATGYSVGAVIEDVDRFLDSLEKGGRRSRGTSSSMRVQRWLRERGMAALMGFDARETGEFFRAFFSLPEKDVFAYLIGASPLMTLRAMAKVAGPLLKLSPRTCGKLISGFTRGPGRWRNRR